MTTARSVVAAVGWTLRNDRLTQVSAALAGGTLVFLVLPVLSADERRSVVAWVGPAIFGLLIPLAFLQGEPRGRSVELAFWRDLTWGAWSALAAVVLRRVGAAFDWPMASLVASVALMLSYTLIVVAVERQPQRQGAEVRGLELRLTLPTILLLVVGLLLYFVVIPTLTDRSLGATSARMSEIFVALGLLLVLRVGYLAIRSESLRWRTFFVLLSMLAASVVALHGRSQDFVTALVGRPGAFGAALWMLPMGLAVVLARVRLYRFPAERSRGMDMVTRLGDHPGGLALRTMFIALTVPTLHFGGYRLGFFDPELLEPRETWVFFWVLGLGAVALYQNRRLSDLLAAAFRERRRIENALANTERSLRLAETRRESDEAVWNKKEKYVKAFRYSPDAMLLTRFDDGTLLEFNNRMLEIVGLSRAEVAGRSVVDLGFWASPEDHHQVMDELRTHGQVRDSLVAVRTADGGVRQVQLSAEVMEVEGERCIFAAARDVTARDENLAALQLQAELLDRCRDAVAVFDDDDIVTYWNAAAAAAFGRSAERVRGRKAVEALGCVSGSGPGSGAESGSEALRAASQSTRARGVWLGSLAARHADGHALHLESFWARVTDAAGEPTAKLVFFRPRWE